MLTKTIKVSQLLISILLSIILLINIFLPNYALAIENPSLPISTNSPELKIDSKLIQHFKQKDRVTFLLKFKEQVDTNKISTEAKENAEKQKQTAAKTELMVRSAVISSLRNTAMETQDSVLEYLEQAKQNGDVDKVESFYVVNAIAVTGSKEVMEKLATYQEVAKILPNETRQLITPIRNKVSSEKSSSAIEWGVERVGAPQAWKEGIDGSGIVVANIDSGVQWDHPALKEKYRGYKLSNPTLVDHSLNWFDAVDGIKVPYDDNKHGTHTMGTIVGTEPNGSNQIGVAPGAKWIAVKAFNHLGGSTDADLLEAGEWILAPKDSDGNPHPELAPDIVNNSWGGGSGLNEWYRPMVQNWRAADIFPVFAAGNSGEAGPGSISNPSNYPESFAVGATDSNNKLTYFSSRGPGPYDESKPNVSAPGANIRSATPTNDYEDGWSGTSMAAPHIAGVVALLKQANASLTIDQIEKLFEDTAIPLTDSEYPTSPNYGYGHGFVNAYNAIKSIQKGNGMVNGYVRYNGIDITKPTYQHTSPSYVFDKEDLPLTIQVQDNISLQSIKLIYQVNGQQKTIEANRTAGDYKNGTYQVNVPGIDVKLNKFTYYWMIEDYAKNQVITNSYEVKVKPAITLGYFQNFESTPEGWYSEGYNNDWEWGISTKEPDKAFSGEKVYATNLEGEHGPNTNSYLHLPPIYVPEDKDVYLTYKQWYDLSSAGLGGPTDFGAVLISTDKQNWKILSKTEPTYDDSNNAHYSSDGWIDGEVDLSAYVGKRIYISFYMHTEDWGFDSVPKSGWAIDDISLSDISSGKNTQKINKANTHIKKDFSNVNIKNPATISSHQPVKQELPIGAQVSILESGYAVSSNPADGFYSMNHNPGNFTIRAEAYGFRSKDQQVTIQEDGNVEANLILEPIEKGKIEGIVKDKETGKPLSNAVISLIEDAAILPVKTDHKGRFSLTAYEGNYTLHVYKNGYVYQDIPISISGKKDRNQKIELQKYIGFTGEIGYDDGTSENSWYWARGAKNGMAVKMTLEEGVSRSWLTGGLFKVNTKEPIPGATRFQVAVYDSSGLNGAPGKKIAGPFEAHAKTDGEWTHVDLADKNIFVSGDFYLTYIQPDPVAYGTSPSLESDNNGPFHERNWLLYNGTFEQVSDPIFGNHMIRAVVNNSLPVPVIESPLNNSFTKESKINVTGKAKPSSTVMIQNNGKDIATGLSKEDGSFTIPVKLKNDENRLTAVSVTKDGRTEPSEVVNIIFDQKKPEITINKIEKIKGKKNEIIIFGKVKDVYLDSAFINDKQIVVDSKGSFKEQVKLNKEESKIVIYAKDKAENGESKTIKIK